MGDRREAVAEYRARTAWGAIQIITDEQRARELAEQIVKTAEHVLNADLNEDCLEAAAKLLLPLIRDQARWQAMREFLVAVDWNYGDPPMAIAAFRLHADRVMAGPVGADAIADAAIDKARLTSPPPSQAAIPTTGD